MFVIKTKLLGHFYYFFNHFLYAVTALLLIIV